MTILQPPNLKNKEHNHHKSSYVHVPTFWSLLPKKALFGHRRCLISTPRPLQRTPNTPTFSGSLERRQLRGEVALRELLVKFARPSEARQSRLRARKLRAPKDHINHKDPNIVCIVYGIEYMVYHIWYIASGI